MTSSQSKKRHRHDEDAPAPAPSSVPTTQYHATEPLQDVPTTQHYHVSYMHRRTVTHSCASRRHGYVLTGSADGAVKFWKRTATARAAPGAGKPAAPRGAAVDGGDAARGLEFAKSYASHAGPLLALCASRPHGDAAASLGYDGVVKFYDVATFDVSGMIRTGDGGGAATFRLGRHAALIEREDLYLLVSTRAPTREEGQAASRAQARRLELLRQRQNDDSDEDEGPRPDSSGDTKEADIPRGGDNMVPPGAILLFSGTNLSPDPLKVITHHAAPVTALVFNSAKQWVVSGDASGVLEVWNVPYSSSVGEGSDQGPLPFVSKLDTDMYALMKKKTYAIDIAISETTKEQGGDGDGHFAVYSSDRKIRLFSFKNCKLVCIYDERMKVYDKLLSSKSSAMGIDAIEYGKRAALEREMEDAHLLSGGVSFDPRTKQALSSVTPASEGSHHQQLHLTFDDTGKYLLLPTIVGVKVINIQTHRVVATVGTGDASSLRFLHLCLCSGDAKINQQMHLARMGGSSAAIKHGNANAGHNDSLLIALAYGKRRFYAFSHRDPLDKHEGGEPDEQTILARDTLNEAPDAADLLEASHMGRAHHDPDSAAPLTTATQAVLRTTHGDITVKLFPKDTPKTIQNFIGHAQSGYYDNILFHRIIPGFMIQTGDPLGDGTGGESIWGGEFEDEICRDLRHDRPFTVSMANAGPNTNGSQFFITTVPTPWLDNKHTVFGRVTGGMEVVVAMEGVKVDELDRPLSEVKILSVDVT